MYAKLIGGQPSYAPRTIVTGGRQITNPSPERLAEAGYLPVREEDVPDTEAYYVPEWREENGELVRGWVESEPLVPEATFTNDDIVEYLGELEYRICLNELGVSESDL